MKIELASIPSTQSANIAGFVAGAKAMLVNMPNPTGNDPMDLEVEFRRTGNCHIYLVTGRWVGPYEADFSHATQSA